MTRYTHDRAGRTDLVTLPNGLTTDHDYDPLGRLVSLSVTRDDPATDAAERTPVASFGYELLGDGRRREVTERRFTPAGTLFSGTRVTYAFDRQGRLTEEDHLTTSAATGSALLAFRDGYTYDPAGNRLSKTHDADRDGDTSGPGDHTVAYDYDDHDDRLLTETRTPGSGGAPVTTAYFHDAAGNTTRVESGGTVTRYGYDLRGRQTETHRDADHTPEAATARDSRGGVVAETAGGVTTTHLLDYLNPTGYSQVLEQRTGSTLTRSFVLGPSVLAQADGQGGEGTAYLVRDAHSGVRGVTDAAGLMAEQYTYDAFGVPLGFDPATARSVHLFHGERFSPALGGSDVRGERVYEAGTGRWRTADRYTPGVGDLSDRNRYAFVGADPVNGRDPSGMFTLSEIGWTSGNIAGKFGFQGVRLGSTFRNARTMIRGINSAAQWVNRAWDQVNIIRDMVDVMDDIDDIMRSFGPRVGSLAHMERSREVPIPAILETRLADMLKAFGRSSFAEEFIGNVVAGLVAKSLGFVSTDLKTGYHGIDGILKHPGTGAFLVLEAKGGTSKLHDGDPKQMSKKWIDDKLDRLLSRERNRGATDAAGLELARAARNVYGAVVRVDITTKPKSSFRIIYQTQKYPIPDSWRPNL